MISDSSPQRSDFEVAGDLPDAAIEMLAALLLAVGDKGDGDAEEILDSRLKSSRFTEETPWGI